MEKKSKYRKVIQIIKNRLQIRACSVSPDRLTHHLFDSISMKWPSWNVDVVNSHNFGKEPPNSFFIQILLHSIQWWV